MASPAELDAMHRAIALSARGLGTTSPNPPVGCVILGIDGTVVGEGYHQRDGEAHAEAHALAAAGPRAAGGTAVVTLEPCNHVGRTPACRQALLDASVARVVVALVDPTSREEGGIARLRAAGVDVETDVLADEARLVLGPWLTALDLHRAHVTWVAEADEATRRTYDVVVSAGGTVHEGQPGGHSPGALRLDGLDHVKLTTDVLADLFERGVRTVLAVGEMPPIVDARR